MKGKQRGLALIRKFKGQRSRVANRSLDGSQADCNLLSDGNPAVSRRVASNPTLLAIKITIILLFVAIAIIVVSFFLSSPGDLEASDLVDAGNDYRNDTSSASVQLAGEQIAADDIGEATIAASQPYSQFYFYDASRQERYSDFAAKNPDLSAEDVVWMIDCDLDFVPYWGVAETPNPSSLVALVCKHRFLPADYYPDDLVDVGGTAIRSIAAQPLMALVASAAAAGVTVVPTSGFRSYQDQADLHDYYVSIAGEAEADNSSARAGFSEHQTGLAMDINSANYLVYGSSEDFWLAEHAWEYGFIVRYTNDNSSVTLYVAEPWHLRYVGKDVSEFMHNNNIGSLEEYYVKHVLYTPSQ